MDDAIESSSGSKLSNRPESSSDNSKWELETLSVSKMIRFDGRRAIERDGVDSKGARTLGVFWKDHHMSVSFGALRNVISRNDRRNSDTHTTRSSLKQYIHAY